MSATVARREAFGTMSHGAVVEYTSECTCAYPDCGGYSMHEPHCGVALIGFLPEEAAVMHGYDPYPEPDMLPTMLWDFANVDAGHLYPEGGQS